MKKSFMENVVDHPKLLKTDVSKNGSKADTSTPTKQEVGIMVRADRKMSEPSGLTKGMTVAIAVGPMLLTVLLAIIGYLLIFTREDATSKTKLESIEKQLGGIEKTFETKNSETREDMRELKRQFEKIDDRLREQERFQDKAGGYRLGQQDSEGK